MIQIGTKKIKDIKKSGNIVKVLKGVDLIWEKNQIKTISRLHPNQISPFSTSITVYDENIDRQLRDRYIIDITIGNYGKFEIGDKFYTEGRLMLNFGGSLDDLLGVTDMIPSNTKITARYKDN